MRVRIKNLVTTAALSALPLAVASAQVRTNVPAAPAQPPTVRPPLAAPSPRQPQPLPPAVVPPPPVVLPPPLWDPRDAMELLAFIQQVGTEGLDPARL